MSRLSADGQPSRRPCGWIAARAARGVPGAGASLHHGRARVGPHRRASSRIACGCSPTASPAPQAINLRHQPIPWAYRVFFRHIGLDPDDQRTPGRGARARADEGRGLREPQPARRRADDRDHRVGRRRARVRRRPGRRAAGIRPSAPARSSRAAPASCPPGPSSSPTSERPLALLFGATAAGRGVRPKTKRTLLVAIRVSGVPEIAVEEALWLAAGGLRG